MKPRIAQLHQSGATDGQAAVWSAALGYWVPGAPAASTNVRSNATATGGETIIYLNAVPDTNSERVWVNGLLLTPGVAYTLVGSIITLTTPLTAGQVVVVSYTSATAGVIGFGFRPTGFTRPVSVTRPVRRFHRIR